MKYIYVGLGLISLLYVGGLVYLYFFQTSLVFNRAAIDKKEPFTLPNVKHVTLEVEGAVLDGVYKSASKQNPPLIIYFGGNADDATRFLLHVKNLEDFDIVSFNYRGYINSTGEPSQDGLYLDALKIYDTFNKGKKVVVIGRSLGTGVATYLASKKEVSGVVLITPYDSILSIAQKKYPMFPISFLLKHQFNSSQNILSVQAPVALIEVANDTVVTKYHFDKLKQNIQNLVLHVNLENTTHGDVFLHKDFGKNILKILKSM